jgi:transposase
VHRISEESYLGSPSPLKKKDHGFESLEQWAQLLLDKHNLPDVIIGMEPTGHYWLNLAYYLKGKGVKGLSLS